MQEPQSCKKLQRVRTTQGPPPLNGQYNKLPGEEGGGGGGAGVGGGGEVLKHFYSHPLGPDATFNTGINKSSVCRKTPNSVSA